MSATLNRVYLLGRLVDDPELRHSGSGTSLCRFRLAIDDSFRSRSGETVEKAVFVDVAAWGAQAETSHRYLFKGNQVLVEGRLSTDEWTDREGHRRSQLRVTATSIQFIGARTPEAAPAPVGQSGSAATPQDRDIPFN